MPFIILTTTTGCGSATPDSPDAPPNQSEQSKASVTVIEPGMPMPTPEPALKEPEAPNELPKQTAQPVYMPQPAPILESVVKTSQVTVTSVNDADTIIVSMAEKTEIVRLIGVDAPETVHPSRPMESYGPEASAYTMEQLNGKTVYLE